MKDLKERWKREDWSKKKKSHVQHRKLEPGTIGPKSNSREMRQAHITWVRRRLGPKVKQY